MFQFVCLFWKQTISTIAKVYPTVGITEPGLDMLRAAEGGARASAVVHVTGPASCFA